MTTSFLTVIWSIWVLLSRKLTRLYDGWWSAIQILCKLLKGEKADFGIANPRGVQMQSWKSREYDHNPEVRIKSLEYDDGIESKQTVIAVVVVNRSSTIERSSCAVKKRTSTHWTRTERFFAVGTVLSCVKDLREMFVTLNSSSREWVSTISTCIHHGDTGRWMAHVKEENRDNGTLVPTYTESSPRRTWVRQIKIIVSGLSADHDNNFT